MTTIPVDIVHEPMAEGPESGPFAEGAWRHARIWVLNALNFADSLSELAVTGLTRRMGLRLSGWLYMIEGTVRRLILATALGLKLAPVTSAAGKSASKPVAPATASPSDPATWRAAFRVFAIHRIRPRPRPHIYTLETLDRMPVKRKPPPRTHIPTGPTHTAFALDPLMAIDAAPARASLPPSKVQPRPYAPKPRKPRITRWHPDYNPQHDPNFFLYGLPSRSSPLDRRHEKPPSRADKPERHPFGHAPIYGATPIDQTLIPAPGLALRIEALRRLMRDPMKCARRIARQLAARPNLTRRLLDTPEPVPRRTKSDKRPLPAQDMLAAAITALRVHDTS
jgi:hypothetical protein